MIPVLVVELFVNMNYVVIEFKIVCYGLLDRYLFNTWRNYHLVSMEWNSVIENRYEVIIDKIYR